jgi:two-component system phosphate regulon sensor histidine kinase PhoR
MVDRTAARDATLSWIRQKGFDLAIPLTSHAGTLLGTVFMRMERLTEPLRSEEREVLQALCDQAASALTRLDLQEAVIIGQEQRRRLQELNDMKSRFVSSVSHDLRTPLTSITMFTEMMLDTNVSTRKQKEFLRLIRHETGRLTRMIAHVLNYSRIERGVREYTFTDVSLKEVVHRSVRAFRPQLSSASGTLSLQLPRRSPVVHADAEALEAALLNLLSNALTYGGEKKRVKLAVVSEGDFVRISVADRGIGISAEVLPHVTEPFTRGASSASVHAGGMGLGLATVRHTIEAHGGSIDIRSTPGTGTTVTLTMLRSDPPEKGVRP